MILFYNYGWNKKCKTILKIDKESLYICRSAMQ